VIIHVRFTLTARIDSAAGNGFSFLLNFKELLGSAGEMNGVEK
jgi:hypothetical protein